MSEVKKPIKSIIRQIVLRIGGKIVEEPQDPKSDFVIRFEYSGRSFSASKPKKRNQVGIAHGFHFDGLHKKALDSMLGNQKEMKKFTIGFSNILHYFGLDFKFNFKENKVVMITKIFLDDNTLSSNVFYDKFMRLFSCNRVLLNYIIEKLDGNGKEDISFSNSTPPSGIYS